MATAAVEQRTSRALPVPLRWLAKMIRNFVFVISGLPVQLAGLAVLAVPWLVSRFTPVSFWQVLAAALLSAGLALPARVPLTFIQRHRCWSVLGVDIPPPPAARSTSLLRRLAESLRSEATWRQLGYHLVIGPVVAAGGLLTLGMLVGGIELTGTTGYSALLPKLGAAPKGKVIVSALGILLLLLSPALAALVTWLDRMAATALLGPSRAVELERRVETLSQSRAGVVDAADAERRRIERDLHDGAQQRLVSLAMNLGIARETLTDLPPEARQVIVAAHDEAKEALTELRNLVRGLHPAVLNDRGLDAALSGIAARAPLPVRLTVAGMTARASPTVEAVAYFVVSECLANIARHSSARQAAVDVRLWVLVAVATAAAFAVPFRLQFVAKGGGSHHELDPPVAYRHGISDLLVRTNGGVAVAIRAGRPGEVAVTSSLSWAVRKPTVSQIWLGGSLRVGVACPKLDPFGGCQASIVISIPAGTPVQAQAGAGTVTVDGLSGPLHLSATSGVVVARNVSGPVWATVTSGSVVAHTGLASDQLSASASSGLVALAFTARPERLTIGVGSGSARITVPAGTRYHIVSSAGSGLVSLAPGLSDSGSGQFIAVSVGAGQATIGYPAGSG